MGEGHPLGGSVTADLRKKRVWDVGDFAEWLGVSHKQAKSILLRLDAEVGGMLLRRTRGANRGYWFFPSVLAKVKPEVFERVESLEARVGELEGRVDEYETTQRRILSQVGQNSRDIARLRPRRSSANA